MCVHVENCEHAGQKHLTRRWTFDLDIESIHAQPSSCRARPMNVDDGFEYIRWIHGRGREVARGALRSSTKPEKNVYLLPSERDREFLSSVFYTSAPKCICTGRLAGARHESPAVEDGSELRMSARGSDFTTQSLVLLIEVCRGLGISPRPSKHLAEFVAGRSCTTSAQEIFFSFFVPSLELVLSRFVLIASGTEILKRLSLKFKLFFGNTRFH